MSDARRGTDSRQRCARTTGDQLSLWPPGLCVFATRIGRGSKAVHTAAVAGGDAQRAMPPGPRPARWGLPGWCPLDPSHPGLVAPEMLKSLGGQVRAGPALLQAQHGAGLHSFALVASRTPLPPYRE